LRRAMTDDALVDRAAQQNLELVRKVADRNLISARVFEYYQNLTYGNR
jgi:hypothetical protein